MKADRLGILSAVVASLCCVTPLVLVVLGLGSLGVGALLGRFHWWFLATAVGLLALAWAGYFREQQCCQMGQCTRGQGNAMRWRLLIPSVVVGTFVGLNLYTYASQHRSASNSNPVAKDAFVQTVIPVEGMTCLTCELTIETSLKHVPGVQSADARVTEQNVYVSYDPTQMSVQELVSHINRVGYKASPPTSGSK